MEKAPEAYRTISEVAEDLDLPQHVLRFWETRFAQIKPLKRGGGRRYYRPEDVDLLKGVRHLLYGEGYTIRGVQRIIKESGVKAIQALGRGEGAVPLQKPLGPDIIAQSPGRAAPRLARAPDGGGGGADRALPPVSAPVERHDAPPAEASPEPPAIRQAAPLFLAGPIEEDVDDGSREPTPPMRRPASPPVVIERTPPPLVAVEPPPSQRAWTQALSARAMAIAPSLGPEETRRLKAALYELLECRKKLDEALAGPPRR